MYNCFSKKPSFSLIINDKCTHFLEKGCVYEKEDLSLFYINFTIDVDGNVINRKILRDHCEIEIENFEQRVLSNE